MESVLKQALPKEVIEVQEVIAPPEPEPGFPWCGTGIAVVVAVIAVGLYKNFKK
jgi:hypothetical protein